MKNAAPNLSSAPYSRAYSLVFALSSNDDSLALTIPCEIIDPGAERSNGKFEAVLGLGGIPDPDVSGHIRRSAVESRGRETGYSRCCRVFCNQLGSIGALTSISMR